MKILHYLVGQGVSGSIFTFPNISSDRLQLVPERQDLQDKLHYGAPGGPAGPSSCPERLRRQKLLPLHYSGWASPRKYDQESGVRL